MLLIQSFWLVICLKKLISISKRVIAFGFLASKEVQKEGLGNFGLYDRTCSMFCKLFVSHSILAIFLERLGLQWVQKYISAFGGDPSKVTM